MEVESLSESENDAFENSITKFMENEKRRGSRKKSKLKQIKIVVNGIPPATVVSATVVATENLDKQSLRTESLEDNYDFHPSDEGLESELDDSLLFFQDTHEWQDPSYIAFQRKLQEEKRQMKLAALDAYDMETRKEIENVISELCKEKQAATDRSLLKYKQRAIQEEKQKTQQQQDLYRQRSASNTRTINDRILQLQQHHQTELSQAMAHHQQQVHQRRLNEQMSAQEWHTTSQQIKAKHNQELESFRNKGAEIKKSAEAEFQREQEKVRKHYLHQLQEIESSRQKLHTKLYQQYQQLRQRYLKRHLQKIMKDKDALLSQGPAVTPASTSIDKVGNVSPSLKNPRELAKSTMEEKAELNPPAPIRSAEEWADQIQQIAGGAARHKHRKSILSQTVRQLNLEIHNEGLWLAPCPPDSESDTKRNDASKQPLITFEFIPWGVKAYQILDSIVSGEIPPGTCERILEKHPNAADLMSVQSGQVRCVVSDLRTSEETASLQRCAAVLEYQDNELKMLEQKVADTSKFSTDAENAYSRALQEEKNQTSALGKADEALKKAAQIQEEFKQKFKRFLGPDGKPIPEASPNDQQELTKALSRHTNNHDVAFQQVVLAKQKLADCREKVQNLQNVVKNAQKNHNYAMAMSRKKQAVANRNSLSKSGRSSRQFLGLDDDDRASFRVKYVIGALRVTAERRRDQSDQKKNTGFSSAWVQSFPGLPSSLKKSLWHKMHRRKQQVILRPTPESLISDLRTNIVIMTAAKFSDRSNSDKMEKIESEMMKAEQLFLLASHPVLNEPLSFVPPTKSNEMWSEPGWKLNLSVPNENDFRAGMILPCFPSFPVLESNLSEIASTPGRQAASLLRTSHFRCLASPLSAFAVASSPAESSSSLSQNRVHVDGDPLHVIEDDILAGYNFTLKQQPKPVPPKRRTSTPKSQQDADPHDVEYSNKRTSASSMSTTNGPIPTDLSNNKASSELKKNDSKRQRNTGKTTAPSSKKSKAESATNNANSIGTQQFSPIVQKQQPIQQHQAPPPPPSLQRQQTQIHHQSSPSHHQRQSVSQQQQMSSQQQRQLQHPGTRHQPSQHHQQLSSSQHHQQLSSSQHHQQHLSQHAVQPHPSQHNHSSQPQFSSPQLSQMRLMQQQGQQLPNLSPRHQQVAATYPPQAIQQMQQFYAPLNHPPAPLHVQGRPVTSHPIPPPHQQAVSNVNQTRKTEDSNDANDPLFMLK